MAHATTTPSTGGHPATTTRVMVVDDSPLIRRMLAGGLRHAGLEVVEASSGEEALARFRQEPSEVVVTDLSMPGLGGLELLADLRHESLFPEVILLTGASADKRSADRALHLGAYDYIPKTPATLAAVLLAVEGALAKRRDRLADPKLRRPALSAAAENEPTTVPTPFRGAFAGAS